MSSKRVTIKKVAEEADVSVASVSRAFNKPDSVTKATRERILKVADELKYRPNSAARSLKTSKTHTIGVILPDLHGAFFSEMIRGIDRTAREHSYHILLSSSHSTDLERNVALQTMNGRVDGLLIMAPGMEASTLDDHLPANIPVHLINTSVETDGYNRTVIDNVQGAYAGVNHLVELGHSRIAIITGEPHNLDAQERLHGYLSALQDGGLPARQEYRVEGNFTETSGYQAMSRILELDNLPTAVFASNDSMAIGALSKLAEADINVPEMMAIVGFDDIPIAAYTSPPLTTVKLDIQTLGARSAERLFDVLSGKGNGQVEEILPTKLVVRESCGARQNITA